MATILERNKKIKAPQKTMQEHAEDALYREVWEDVNNEKTQQFIKKYGKYMVWGAIFVMVVTIGIQQFLRARHASKIAMAENYETALAAGDVNALVGISKNADGATADMALFQAYILDNNIEKLEDLAQNGKTAEFRDLAKLHVIGARGDDMTAAEVEEYLSPATVKDAPFYYTTCLTIAQKYVAAGEQDNANKWLDKILNDNNAPATVRADAEVLR